MTFVATGFHAECKTQIFCSMCGEQLSLGEKVMARTLFFSVLTILFSSAVLAQDESSSTEFVASEPVVVEMKIQRSLSAEFNGIADTLASVQADKLVLHYELQNTGERDIELAPVTISEEINGTAVVVRQPELRVVAQGSAIMVVEVRPPQEAGPFSFVVSTAVDGEAYTFEVQATVTAVLDHEHDDHHHHCSTGESGSGLLLGAVAAVLAGLMVRRRLS
jgi:MYXO-CTERM domain-containing protein